jgi:DNA-binding transcriptional MerR regulator
VNKLTILFFSLILVSCESEPKKIKENWIQGSEYEKIQTIEKQFRGFDMAMVETGYRYQELYWAGQDQNWEYADYQIEKIRKAIENGLERRPKRAKSAEHFLTVVLPEMKKSLKERDTLVFNENFQMLTNNCVSCHAMEKVPHFIVQKPLYRISPIRK